MFHDAQCRLYTTQNWKTLTINIFFFEKSRLKIIKNSNRNKTIKTATKYDVLFLYDNYTIVFLTMVDLLVKKNYRIDVFITSTK